MRIDSPIYAVCSEACGKVEVMLRKINTTMAPVIEDEKPAAPK